MDSGIPSVDGPSDAVTTGASWPVLPLPPRTSTAAAPLVVDATSGSTEPPSTASASQRPRRPWLRSLVALLLAGLVGGLVGGWVASGDRPAGMTIQSSDAAPGAARLPNGASIPSLVQRVVHSVVSIDVRNNGQEDQGTGMIITADGMVVTNNHVIALGANGGTITVTASGSTKALPTVLVGADPSNDVALLRIENASGLTPVTFGNSSKIEVGDAAVAIGNALGLAAGTPTVTSGIISALGRTVTAGDGSSGGTETLTNMIQTDAAINPGNSGGPLLDSAGEVIGMNTAVAGSSVGSNAQNIGFAITSARIKSLLPQLEKGGTSTSNHGGYMGVQIATLTPDLREQYNLVPTEGAVILDVMAGSPASSAGLRQGDVIVEIDGKKITSADQVTEITRSHKPGDALKVTVQRGRERLDLKVTLGTPPQ